MAPKKRRRGQVVSAIPSWTRSLSVESLLLQRQGSPRIRHTTRVLFQTLTAVQLGVLVDPDRFLSVLVGKHL